MLRGHDEEVQADIEVTHEHTHVALLHGRGRLERQEAEPVEIEERHFLAVAESGQILERGGIGEAVQLSSPEAGAALRTRGQVRFEWEPSADADRYRIELFYPESNTFQTEESALTSAVLPVRSGACRWRVRGLRAGIPQRVGETRELTVTVDRVAPTIEIMAPAEGAVVRTASVEVRGRAEPRARVWVSGQTATVDRAGQFTARVPVARGITNVVVRASDDLGNVRTRARAVVRQ